MPVQISKKRKFVQDGVFKAELNEFLTRELAEDGYSGVENIPLAPLLTSWRVPPFPLARSSPPLPRFPNESPCRFV